MEPLFDSLKKRLDRQGLDQAISAASHLVIAKRVLPGSANPKSLRNGVMWIEIDSPTEAYFFNQELDDYIEKINAALGQPLVTSLRLRVLHKQ